MSNKILIVEDDNEILNNIKLQFEKNGFIVDGCKDGLCAEKQTGKTDYDCIILDINLPLKNGFEVCKSLRNREIKTPIIMLTAFSDLDDKINGFGAGADDYLTKPFFFQELMARVNVQIKKNTKENLENNTITIGELVIDTYKKIVYRNNIEIILTPKEYNILLILAKSEGVPISKKDLIKKMWGTTLDVNTNTIEVFINSLRNKIDKNHSFKMIQTKYGFGYFINDKNET